jgi:very-short-patch-repair endonuclease
MHRPHHDRLAHVRARVHRRQLTISEARLWSGIKSGATGARFRRQVPIGKWIADFASLTPKLVVEVDDPSHDLRDETARTLDIETAGFAILRFTNHEIATEVHAAISTIEYWVEFLRRYGQPPE